ncbi:hypothetical protein K458DRAFT_400303 [Lentithecium fluviatile CBS 122367]|uniref:Uncharacterized protein n=1 Tax=Lentithecium fluviatile CBS 122367 TaxID=1168545 RepID=A0A6G1JH67_9PLEO|nr:hypothetical protein K458DRAFT_400303 [Lentithecium fluviatile CBS 122367]
MLASATPVDSPLAARWAPADSQGADSGLRVKGTLRTPIKAHIVNKYPFSVYFYQTVKVECNRAHPNTPTYEVKPRKDGWFPIDMRSTLEVNFVSNAHDCGISVKISRNSGSSQIYQVEYTVLPDGAIWYNLSHEKGNPFTDVACYLYVRGTASKCLPLYCAPGDSGSGCDWRDAHSEQYANKCDETEDVHFILC